MVRNKVAGLLLSSLFAGGLTYRLFFSQLPDLDLRARLFRLLLIFLLTAAVLQFLYCVVKSTPRLASFFLCFSSLFFLFCLLEALFMFYPRSHGSCNTLACQLWVKNFRQLNSYNYRDKEYALFELQSKRRIFILGDSFVEGHGIKRNADRFTDILAHKLSEHYAVLNLGMSGSNSIDEFERLKKFTLAPHLLVLSYFGDDIVERASREGFFFHHLNSSKLVPSVLSVIVARSYFINYIYWNFLVRASTSYLPDMKQAYSDPRIFDAHQKDLMMIINWCRNKEIPLLVVLFPFLSPGIDSWFYVEPMVLFFQGEGVPVLSVQELMKDVDEKKWVVNKDDLHPSRQLHHRVADALYDLLMTHNLIIPD